MNFLHKKRLYLFPLVLFISICLLYIVLEPKIAERLFPFRRNFLLIGYLSSLQKTQNIDTKSFWQFREFYSPGYFTFNQYGINNTRWQQNFDVINFSSSVASLKPFLVFTSPLVTSYDFLIPSSQLNTTLIPHKISDTVLLDKNNVLLISHKDESTLAFIKPINEIQKANGFFEFIGDKQALKNKVVLDITEIK